MGKRQTAKSPVPERPGPTSQEAPSEETAPSSGRSPFPILPARPRRILVVDDNIDAADSLAILLRPDAHDVVTAHSGPAALEVAAARQPDVIVLDIGLPGMDGYELARRLREERDADHFLLVTLTGYGQDDYRRLGKLTGFDHYLTKPADMETLRQLNVRHAPMA
jgi:CheY-like chemotaxis protein